MCWPSHAQISPPSSRMTVAVRSSASVAVAASLISAGRRRAEHAVAEGCRVAGELVPALQRIAGAGFRIRPVIGVVVAPGRRRLVGDRRIGRSAERPVDVAGRKAPGDGEAHLLASARRERDARRKRAVLGLQAHMPRGPRLVVVPLRQPAGARELLPEHGEIVEPLAAVVDSRCARHRRHRWRSSGRRDRPAASSGPTR